VSSKGHRSNWPRESFGFSTSYKRHLAVNRSLELRCGLKLQFSSPAGLLIGPPLSRGACPPCARSARASLQLSGGATTRTRSAALDDSLARSATRSVNQLASLRSSEEYTSRFA
jgi:hypothetical protein